MDTLKFKLKFSLRSYFFYFSLPLFKTLPLDSLFLTLFYLNIHSLFIFLLFPLIFHNSQNTFFSYFPPTLSLLPLYFPSLFFFFFFFHHPRTTSFLFLFSFFLSFFPPHHPRTPSFLFTSPPPNIHPPLFISFLNSQTSHSEYLSPVSLFFSSFFFFPLQASTPLTSLFPLLFIYFFTLFVLSSSLCDCVFFYFFIFVIIFFCLCDAGASKLVFSFLF
jgi:hypothetical protein